MRFFKLPDLGEGLQEAEIVEWHVAAGDAVAEDQLLVSVETAKAIVEIPSPQAGTLAQCFGTAGTLLHIGDSLVEYANEEDTATVAGDIPTALDTPNQNAEDEDTFFIGTAPDTEARQAATRTTKTASTEAPHGARLTGTRRAMAKAMRTSHQQVAAVTLCEDADIHLWPAHTDTTARLCRAIAAGVCAEPLFNAWFDSEHMTLQPQTHIDLGIAVDTQDGLFVPVLRDIAHRDAEQLRAGINQMRRDVQARAIPPKEMQGATITLSNFGSLTAQPTADNPRVDGAAVLAGRYASPLVVPPCVAIMGAGGARATPVAIAQGDQYSVEVHRLLPLSLTFDHRVLTGGEGERFLAACIGDLQRAD